jgi:hypothetical protein
MAHFLSWLVQLSFCKSRRLCDFLGCMCCKTPTADVVRDSRRRDIGPTFPRSDCRLSQEDTASDIFRRISSKDSVRPR